MKGIKLQVYILIIATVASSLGAIVGFGGGVIIKPILDAMQVLPVSTVSFLSGCTALAMAIVSIIQNRKGEVKIERVKSTILAFGAVGGGIIGKYVFEIIRIGFENEDMLGGIQAVLLTAETIGVFVYICKKESIISYKIEKLYVCLVIGIVLGFIASFLGIGGGTTNMALLFLFFSMDAKTAAINSLYIIIFAQSAGIVTAIISNTVPEFTWINLIIMITGGICGAIIGRFVTTKISVKCVENIFKSVLICVLLIDAYNMLSFFGILE